MQDSTTDSNPTNDSGESTKDKSHRDNLVELLTNNSYECMICYNRIRSTVAVTSCSYCFHIFHLYCIKQWLRTEYKSKDNSLVDSWRCPACQTPNNNKNRLRYYCFCGKTHDPNYSPHYVPHTCGEVCGKLRGINCSHPCNLLCHPGPCPPCQVSVKVKCSCQRSEITKQCYNINKVFLCDNICGKKLSCGKHLCQSNCHSGPCENCTEKIYQVCVCEKSKRELECANSTDYKFYCEKICEKLLACGHHTCKQTCHAGDCRDCDRDPSLIKHCACGQTKLSVLQLESRVVCTDPIPTCGNVCGRFLPTCGHSCPIRCHDSPSSCPPCKRQTKITCRCGKLSRQLSCEEARVLGGFLCSKRCRQLKSCGVHSCNQVCCVEQYHFCSKVCGKLLSCGNHTCEAACHPPNRPCQPCERWNLNGLSCHCGAVRLPPPVSCSAILPQCMQACMRPKNCFHPVDHPCHPCPPECPPCLVLVEKLCPGAHRSFNNVPCFQPVVTCGAFCEKLLICNHLCQLRCHVGNCPEPDQCKQLCSIPREDCGHPCNSLCHWPRSCEEKISVCTFEEEISCSCGNRKAQIACNSMNNSPENNKTIELGCDFSCQMSSRLTALKDRIDSHKQDSEITEVSNVQPALLEPVYTDFLKKFGLNRFDFVLNVENIFQSLLHSLYDDNYLTNDYQFEVLPFDDRHFIHELSDYYNIKSESRGIKPRRYVVVTATKKVSYAPILKLSTVIYRENPELPRPRSKYIRLKNVNGCVSSTDSVDDWKLPNSSKISRKLINENDSDDIPLSFRFLDLMDES